MRRSQRFHKPCLLPLARHLTVRRATRPQVTAARLLYSHWQRRSIPRRLIEGAITGPARRVKLQKANERERIGLLDAGSFISSSSPTKNTVAVSLHVSLREAKETKCLITRIWECVRYPARRVPTRRAGRLPGAPDAHPARRVEARSQRYGP